LDRTGYLNNIVSSVVFIYKGRHGLDTEGRAEEGRVNYRDGLTLGIKTFREVRALAGEDLELPVACEYTFLNQELQFCANADDRAKTSLEKAIDDFDGAFRALEVLNNAEAYKLAEKTYAFHKEFRYKGLPRDAFHVACAGHSARIDNNLKTPGVNLLEKALLKERRAAMQAVQAAYLEKQRRTLAAA
jgi:hypothetical protein